jgi:UDP-N-acetylmuramate--alanine ligase
MAGMKNVHFIGIGGAGMSGIALVLHERGYNVTGSDLKASRYVRELERAGIDVTIGHEAATIDAVAPDVVVTSTAIPATNPEVVRAKELGIEIWPRAKMLSALSDGRVTVAVAGTHGKTTTSSMVATMLDRMDLDPSFLIGGIVEGYDTNGRNGSSEYFVAEADESDGSFLYLHPDVVVVTNIEADHLDHYGTLEAIEDTFVEFMASAGPDGRVIACGDSPRVVELAKKTGVPLVTYGLAETNDFVCVPQATEGLAGRMTVKCLGAGEVDVTIAANPGVHNLLNATAAICVAYALGLDLEKAAEALSGFAGVRRRFTHVGDIDGVTVVDDYGHHPTEIAATLKAAKALDYDRVFVVFQPHRYSRTQALADDFAEAFENADELVVMDVFSAGEMPIPGVSGNTVAKGVAEKHPGKSVAYVPTHHEVIEYLMDNVKPGDLLVTMGAGDVTQVGPDFIEHKKQ